jgi:hypothetical protein
MIKRAVKEIMAHVRLSSPLGRGAAGWAAAILVPFVLLAISLLPRAFGQSRRGSGKFAMADSSAGGQTRQSLGAPKMPQIRGGQSQLLPYDVRRKPPGSQLPRGFYEVNSSVPHTGRARASKNPIVQLLQPSGICPSTITQSTSQAIVTGSVACTDPGIGTLENHYWRAFDMNTFTGGQAYDITSVEFGVEQALSLFGTDQPLTVNLYTNHGSPFPGGDWQSNLLASSGEIRVPNEEFTVFNVPLTTTVPAGTLELVMEVKSPDQTVEHNFLIIGSNPDPETGPSYLSAPDCGNPDPVATRCIGFPDMHYVFNVIGSCAGGSGTPTPTPTATPHCPPTVVTGSIDNSDPTQNDRLNRGVISGCCGTTYPCQIFGDGQLHHYDAFTVTNTTGSTQCVTVDINTDCQGSNFIFTAAYLGTFDPNNICTNG